jgi:hypothetical protein
MCAWPVCIPPPRRKVTRGEIAPVGVFYALRDGMLLSSNVEPFKGHYSKSFQDYIFKV